TPWAAEKPRDYNGPSFKKTASSLIPVDNVGHQGCLLAVDADAVIDSLVPASSRSPSPTRCSSSQRFQLTIITIEVNEGCPYALKADVSGHRCHITTHLAPAVPPSHPLGGQTGTFTRTQGHAEAYMHCWLCTTT
ncbi:Equisetin synthetase eqxS, partial [Dissostichus eleginoides]